LGFAERQDIVSTVKDFSASRRNKLQKRFTDGALAAAAFSHQSNGGTLFDGEADIVHGPDISRVPSEESGPDGEIGSQIFDFEKGHGI
jgi:hypothetical protein